MPHKKQHKKIKEKPHYHVNNEDEVWYQFLVKGGILSPITESTRIEIVDF